MAIDLTRLTGILEVWRPLEDDDPIGGEQYELACMRCNPRFGLRAILADAPTAVDPDFARQVIEERAHLTFGESAVQYGCPHWPFYLDCKDEPVILKAITDDVLDAINHPECVPPPLAALAWMTIRMLMQRHGLRTL